ncbi:nucleotidyltransferase domain-containing protein [Anaeromicrobium sediminis]|uniref:Nucleotidyltransferase n=1 Tax=Anaeromicrobium sediminis TaxID=1478221 RepID=A0A267MN49_9FIRM|nr:nucleotidyltransferase domain-containing protein [Anaeromicrobium sediminis]PAB61024.1 nucleotidyltransferase [Anaeromicrobium sediminis]
MDIKEIEQEVKSKKYNFLRENEHLGKNIILLTLGGSYSYGTNVESSDLDIRGVALNKPQELLGMSNFEQFENRETDTTVYSFKKMVNLLLNSNPNIVEMFGCKEDHYLVLTDIGKLLKDNIDLFISQKAINSFGGYANQQLRRLQNALARDNYPQSEKEQHILNSINNQMTHIERVYEDKHGIKLYIDKSSKEDYENEIFMDISTKHYPLRDFKCIYSEMNNVVKEYSKLNHRNRKKDDLHLNKHAMHLIRLYLMAIEILEGQGINTYRENDRKLLLEIRNGKYMKEDGSYRSEFFEWVDELDKKLKYAKKNTSLPKTPNMKKVEEFVIAVNRKAIVNDK